MKLSIRMHNSKNEPIDWVTAVFLVVTPLASLILIPVYILQMGWSWPLFSLLAILGALSNLSITAGYHRCLSHRSYQPSLWLKSALLFFGAGAFQGPALKWCTDHRRHHQFVDTEKDPYNINRGFFFSHMGWLLTLGAPEFRKKYARDLENDRLIYFQNKYYLPIALLSGFGLPMAIGALFGSPFGGLLWGGLLRVVITQHSTFLINSYCHYFGKKSYGNQNSARDSWFISFFTHGEGYHNFHHHFEGDYRNGVRWFDWDPTKWFIALMATFGLARSLRRAPPEKILSARLRVQENLLLSKGASPDWVVKLRQNLEESMRYWQELKKEYAVSKANLKRNSLERVDELRAKYESLRIQRKIARQNFKMARVQWRNLIRVHPSAYA
jgi:stearoyl-CoA desaturase (Delta-9 desaturase)